MSFRNLAAPLLALLALLDPAISAAQSDTAERERLEQRAADILAVLQGEKAQEEVFADSFSAAIPPEQVQAMQQQMEGQMGALVGIESVEPTGLPGAADLSLRFEQAIASGPMQLEAAEPYKVSGLRLDRVEPVVTDTRPVLEQLRELPGATNLLLARLDGSETVLEHNADTALALGSSFKLYVLSALVQEVAAGRRAWDEVVALDTESYPSGILQDWPRGTPLTLQTLATLMISISDNTATDQLIATLGRDVVEAELRASGHSAPELTLPLLTTREMFLLKTEDDVNLGEYASLGTPERLAMLQALQQREVARDRVAQAFGGSPRALDVEWFASPRDIARIFARLVDDPVALGILGINTAIGEEAAASWNYVGFKGGSEPGVLNMSWLLRGSESEWYVLTLGWNNPDEAVSAPRLLGLARQALAAVGPAGN